MPSNPTSSAKASRRAMWTLLERPLSANQLARALDVPIPRAKRVLAYLHRRALVESFDHHWRKGAKEGTYLAWRLTPAGELVLEDIEISRATYDSRLIHSQGRRRSTAC